MMFSTDLRCCRSLIVKLAVTVAMGALAGCATPPPVGLKVQRTADAVSIRKPSGEPIATYYLRPPAGTKLLSESGGFFHPLMTPKGVVVTDLAPSDHPHHRGLFLGWVEMHGEKDADFWGWGEHAPVKGRRIVNRDVVLNRSGFFASNDWIADDTLILEERLTARAHADARANDLDLFYTLTPKSDITIARWAFSGFCLRMRKDGEVAYYSPNGMATNKNPSHLNPDTDWPDAPWYAASIKLPDGTRIGAAVINGLPNRPTLWHNHRDIRIINPCIVAPAELKLKKGQALLLRYRVVTFDGEVPVAALNELTAQFGP